MLRLQPIVFGKFYPSANQVEEVTINSTPFIKLNSYANSWYTGIPRVPQSVFCPTTASSDTCIACMACFNYTQSIWLLGQIHYCIADRSYHVFLTGMHNRAFVIMLTQLDDDGFENAEFITKGGLHAVSESTTLTEAIRAGNTLSITEARAINLLSSSDYLFMITIYAP